MNLISHLLRSIFSFSREKSSLSDNDLRVIAENSPDAIFITDKNGNYLYTNTAASQLLGYTKEELIKKNISDISAIKKSENKFKNFKKLLNKGKLYTNIYLRRKDGSKVIVDLNAVVLPNEMIYGSCRNLTEKEKMRKDLVASEQKYKILFNSVKDAIFIHEFKTRGFGKFIEVNDSACKKYGYSKKEFLKLTPVQISAPPDVKLQGSSDGRRKLLKENWLTFEVVHITKKGKKFPVEISARLFELEGTVIEMSIVKDISERKKIEEDQRDYKKNLEEKVRERTMELELKNSELERLFEATIDREFRVKELIDELKKEREKKNRSTKK